MSADAFPIHPHALLEHQEFVRSLAKSLLRDEHAAQDISQETLLTLLTHPPRSLESVRGWLAQVARNRAGNVAREEARRVRRESAAARPEADDSDARMNERLELQHRVVEAVLSLREPYKTVIVLAYYEGLSPTEIAARRNLAAGTVRSQLSRAHEMLRQKLDTECEGGRSAWSVGLAGIVARSKPVAIGAKLGTTTKILAASLLVGGVVVPLALWWIQGVPSRVIRMDSYGHIIPEGSVVDSSPEPSEAAESSESANSSRVPVDRPADSVASVAQKAEVSELDEMLTEARQIQLILRERWLTPDRELIATRRDLAALSGIGFARMWENSALGSERNNRVGLRGAASYLSFATGLQDSDHEPDLSLDNTFRSGFDWGSVGAVIRLEATRLRELVDERSPLPPSVDAETWRTLWQESKVGERSIPDAFNERLSKIEAASDARVVLGATYIVRSVCPGDHDILGAFEVIARDDKSATIAWRVLKRWDVPRKVGGAPPDPMAGVAPPPASLKALSIDELIARKDAIAARAFEKILGIPKNLPSAMARYASEHDGGLARIAERPRWDSLLTIEGGGAYWSFTQRSNDYQKDPQIGLEQGRFKSGFAGYDRGWVLDVGEIPLDQVTAQADFPALDERGREALTLLRDIEPVPISADRTGLKIDPRDHHKAGPLGLHAADATVGHTYLVRSVQTDRQDVLAAFQVLARDEGGLTLAWKILRQRPASR